MTNNTTGQDSDDRGYWAARWAEFKRLFVLMAWHNVEARMRLILGFSVAILGLIYTAIWE